MPSKKSGKVKSPKQSKAEKEKLRKDDAELLEKEEERMLKLQQERKEKEECERLEKQEKERLAQQEREAHEVEVDELNELLREKFNEIKSAEITNKENFKNFVCVNMAAHLICSSCECLLEETYNFCPDCGTRTGSVGVSYVLEATTIGEIDEKDIV